MLRDLYRHRGGSVEEAIEWSPDPPACNFHDSNRLAHKVDQAGGGEAASRAGLNSLKSGLAGASGLDAVSCLQPPSASAIARPSGS